LGFRCQKTISAVKMKPGAIDYVEEEKPQVPQPTFSNNRMTGVSPYR